MKKNPLQLTISRKTAEARRFALVCLMVSGAVGAEDNEWALCKKNALFDFYAPELRQAPEAEDAATDAEARQVKTAGKDHYELVGDARVTRSGQRLAAERIEYDTASQTAVAEGQVRYQDRDLLLSASRIEGDLVKNNADLSNVRYQLIEARGNGKAERARLTQNKTSILSLVSFTTCDPDKPSWEISAREIELDHEKGFGKARNMKLRFKGKTLLALPYASFPIDDRRRSGFLYPSFAVSSNGGLDLAMPYYLNLAPNYDATLVPRLIARRGLMAGGEFRYLTERHNGYARLTYLPNDREAGRERYSVQLQQRSYFSPAFSFAADINRVSDDRYFEDFGDSLTTAATSLLPSSAYLYGRGENWDVAFGGDDVQITDPGLPYFVEPYRRLPRLTANAEKQYGDFVRVGVRSEFVTFQKDDALEGSRADVTPYIAFPLDRAAGYVHPEVALRQTNYDLDRDFQTSPSRTTPIGSVDAGLFFERSFVHGGKNFMQTLEPRLYYLYVPYKDQSQLPTFDTGELTFSFAQLFRSNRFTGADRQMDANNLTLAMSSRLIQTEDGQERLRASIGQIRYFDDQQVQLPNMLPTDYSGSDYAAELEFMPFRNWRLVASHLYDPNQDGTDLSALRVQYHSDRNRIVNLSYRYRKNLLEQVDLSASWPVSDRVSLVGRWNYSLFDAKPLETMFGIAYEQCCYAVRLLGRHYVRNTFGDAGNAIFLELELKGIGSLGKRTEDFLKRAILGYRQ